MHAIHSPMLSLLKAEKRPAPVPQYEERSISDWRSDEELYARLTWLFKRYLHRDVGIQEKVGVRAFGRRWEVDYVFESANQRVGICIEETGSSVKNLHEDVILADLGVVDVLYRFKSTDLQLRMVDCLYVLLGWHPSLFNAESLAELEQKVSGGLRGFLPGTGTSLYHFSYPFQPELDAIEGEYFAWPDEAPPSLVVRRLSVHEPTSWMALLDQAYTESGIPHEMRSWGWSLSA